jgi:hypothetical protein
VLICLLRIATEIMNHDAIARYHNAGDRWRFMYPFW